jgi:hypothetical protein
VADELYHVYQFFEDGSYERVREFVPAADAAKAVHHYTQNVAARLGMTVRVIITDMGDQTCFEWKFGQGITFPGSRPPEDPKADDGD